MRVNVSDISAQRLFLGWTGENKHIQFAYDFTGMFTEYPDAGVSMTVHPPVGDDYPHTLTRDGNILLWEALASDCAHEGDGTYQITFTQGEHVAKSLMGFFTVRKSLTGSGEAPEPVQDWIADAEAALFALTGMQARAVTLEPGSAATAQIVEENGRKVIVIGVPEGLRGVPGAPGAPGADGVTPAFSIGTVTTLPAGSPATVTITGTTEAPVLNLGIPRGADGQAGDLIDDNAGAGVTGKTWSANKLAADQTAVLSAISQKIDSPETPGTAGQVLGLDDNLDPAWVDQTGGDESGLAPVIKSTASGEVASFADGADGRAIDSLVVNITPVQSGTGDPSPENVRPITGWTGCNVSATGRNLFDESRFALAGFELITLEESPVKGYYYGKARSLGYNASSAFCIQNGGFVGQKMSGILRVSFDVAAVGSRFYLRFYYDDGEDTGTLYGWNAGTVAHITARSSLLRNCIGVNIITVGGVGSSIAIKNLQVEFGEPEHDYEKFGAAVKVDWQSVAGTVPGGYIDVISGKLVVTDAEIASYNGETLPGEWISDRDVYAEGTTPTIGAQVVYKLAEPIEYQLPGNTIATVKGINNIWASCGSISSVQYSADTKTYVDDAIPSVPVQDVQVNGVSVLTDGVANVPVAIIPVGGTASNLGVVKVRNGYDGLRLDNSGTDPGRLSLYPTGSSQIKAGNDGYLAVTTMRQHEAAFYGLAKASGDTSQASSSNAVGTYTDSAKSAIHEMLNGSVSVSGTTPTITALPGIRYVCGEVSTLTVNLPASGIVDVVFESGSTATVLTINPPTGVTLKWANGFDPTTLDANTVYEINIADGLGVAVGWT